MLALVPHQDDELLIMGAALRNATAAGREVHLVLFGLGDGTAVRRRDMPALLGREPSPEEIGRVRDREFSMSAHLLGVERAHVHAATPRQREKSFTRDTTHEVVTGWVQRLPDAEVWVVSEHDENPDHSVLGAVVADLAANGGLRHPARAFVAPWCRDRLPHPPLERETADIGYREQYPYRYTDVAAGQWGVGLRSVRGYFDAQLDDPACWSHRLEPATG